MASLPLLLGRGSVNIGSNKQTAQCLCSLSFLLFFCFSIVNFCSPNIDTYDLWISDLKMMFNYTEIYSQHWFLTCLTSSLIHSRGWLRCQPFWLTYSSGLDKFCYCLFLTSFFSIFKYSYFPTLLLFYLPW